MERNELNKEYRGMEWTMGRKEWVFRVSGLALNKSPDVIMLNNEKILD